MNEFSDRLDALVDEVLGENPSKELLNEAIAVLEGKAGALEDELNADMNDTAEAA